MPGIKELTLKQKKLADEYLKTGNKTQSALIAYNTTDHNTAGAIGVRELRKDKVREYIKSKSEEIAKRMNYLANQEENLSVSFQASKDILDRAGYKPVEQVETVNILIDDNTFNRLLRKYNQ